MSNFREILGQSWKSEISAILHYDRVQLWPKNPL